VTCLGADDEEVCLVSIIGCDNVIAGSDTKISGQSTDESKIETELSAWQERTRVGRRTHWSTLDLVIVSGLTRLHGVQTCSKL
jgi:hypothetical protein